MPKLNTNLIRSVLQDLKNIVDVCSEVTSWVGDVACVSWRYPTQNCDTIHVNTILLDHTGPASECYLLLLELIYDRLHYLLNLLIKYLDVIPTISKEFSVPRNIICPQQLSLGALFNMFWQRISALHQHINELMVEDVIKNSNNKNKEKAELSHNSNSFGTVLLKYSSAHNSHSRSTQTQAHSLIACESCYMSEQLVKCLVMHIESKCKENFIPSAISEKRLHMKDAVFCVSQWSAMICWVEAILKDSDTLTDTLSSVKVCNKNLKKEIQLLETTIDKKLELQIDKVTHLTNELSQLHHKLEVEESKYADILCEKKKVDSELILLTTNLKQIENKLTESEISRDQLLNSNEQLKSDIITFSNKLRNSNDFIKEHQNKCETWKNKYLEQKILSEDLENQLHEITNKLNETQNNFKLEIERKEIDIKDVHDKTNSLKNELQLCRNSLQKQGLEVQSHEHVINSISTNKNHAHLMSNISKLEKELQESRARERVLLEYPDFNAPLPQKVCGDPVQDMEAQVGANEIRIKLLQEQNQKLENTIQKLRKLSTKH